MEVTGGDFYINWVSVPIFLIVATSVAVFARHASGGWLRPWISIKPVWWFLLLFLVPWVGVPLLVGNLIIHRRKPGAFTGRDARG